MADVKIVERNGIVLATGALIRPRDVREDKFGLARTLPPRAVDLSQPRIQVRTLDPNKYNQGGLGSCALASTAKAGERLQRMYGRENVLGQHFGWGYEQTRRAQGWFPNDSGMYIATACDLWMQRAPALNAYQYVENAAFDYPDAMDADSARSEDYLQGHRPFYPSEGAFIENAWAAIDAGETVVMGSYWPNEWFYPQHGKIPEGVRFSPQDGGHAWECIGVVPGYFIKEGTWSTGWSPDAADFGYGIWPGCVAIPWSYAQSGHIYEARSLTAEPIMPQPDPQPQPDDTATRIMAAIGTVRKAQVIAASKTKGFTAAYYRNQGGAAVEAAAKGAEG